MDKEIVNIENSKVNEGSRSHKKAIVNSDDDGAKRNTGKRKRFDDRDLVNTARKPKKKRKKNKEKIQKEDQEAEHLINDSSSNWKTHTTNLWSSIEVEFVVKFDMTVETKKKDEIMRDPLAFKDGEEYYKRIGKAWKRGYLLYKEKNEEDREDKSDEEASDLEEEIRVDKVSEWTDYSARPLQFLLSIDQRLHYRIVRETDANLTKHTEDWLINLDEASKLHGKLIGSTLIGELDNIQEERDALRNQHKRKLDDNGVENLLNKMKRREVSAQ
ncbi:hypothetical protein Bca4012_065036 [Brassica carinata]